MTNYFMATNGSDSNTGFFGSAWQTLQYLNDKIVDGTVKRGDKVYFRRGDVFYGILSSIGLSSSGSGQLEFLAGGDGGIEYGAGPAPEINAYKTSKDVWVEHSTGIWRINLADTSTDYDGSKVPQIDIGHLRVGETYKAVKRSTLGGLANEWDFYSDTAYLYVKKTTSPGAGIRMAPRRVCVSLASNTTIRGFKLTGSGSHGISGIGVTTVAIEDNIIDSVGGSYLYQDARTVRYGNGIELFSSTTGTIVAGPRSCRIVGNHIRQTYDVGITAQGDTNGGVSIADIFIARNLIEHCNQSIEFWATTTGGGQIVRVKFWENICAFAGESWAANVRDDLSGKGVHVLTYNLQGNVDIDFRRNLFFGAKDSLANTLMNPAGLVFTENTIALKSGQKLIWQNVETINAPAESKFGVGSSLVILPDPALSTPGDVLSAIAAQSVFNTELAKYWRSNTVGR